MKFKGYLQRLNTPFVVSIFPFFIIYFLILFSNTVKAEEIETQTFTTPKMLAQSTLDNSEQVQQLLNSDVFLKELKVIAKQLSANKIAQQSMFNKTALLSIRNEYQHLITVIDQQSNALNNYHYTLHSQAMLELHSSDKQNLTHHLTTKLNRLFSTMSDERLFKVSSALGWSVKNAENYVANIFRNYKTLEKLSRAQAINLIVNTQLYQVIAKIIPVSQKIINRENNKRYQIEPAVLITTDEGIELTATIVRRKNDNKKRPTAFQFTIYADEKSHVKTAIHAAAHGYVGVIVNSRGKRLSTNTIVPWEHEGKDATSAIDWITKQPWSDGQVAMYGGSYNGFTQWAAAKYMHPALKTIVPYAAASPITGLPYENNIVLTANYEWYFHVTNNNTMDNSVYADWQKTDQRNKTLFESGRAIREMPSIDGKANPWFEKLLDHPSYDEFYQAMLPYQQDYARINIPVLSITGYFDGGQISAVDFLTSHYKYNKNANHSLLIGPYSHGTAQGIPRSHQSNYQLDEVALEKDTEEIAFEWFDHVLFEKPKPKLVQDKVNYQLMGSNTWQHHSSFEQLNNQSKSYYLSKKQHKQKNNQGYFLLSESKDEHISSFNQTIDMTDRTTEHNENHWKIIEDKLNAPNGIIFMTKPMTTTQQFAGSITGQFSLAINKKDVDIGYNFYEMKADGSVFHLNRYISRASFANDMSLRKLLIPNQKTVVPITNNRMTAKLIEKGSRLVMVLNVNKNVDAQVNLGSGKEVNSETIADAGEPLTIKWFNDSVIKLPLTPWNEEK
ncbi:CocE/NonD family hydrolase [Colwelliaceae bacterium 6441]